MSNIVRLTGKKYEKYTNLDLQLRINTIKAYLCAIDRCGTTMMKLNHDTARLVPEHEGILVPFKFQFEYLTTVLQETQHELNFRMGKT